MRLVFTDAVADRLVPEINNRWSGFGTADVKDIDITVANEATTFEEIRGARSSGDDRSRFEAFLDSLGTGEGPTVYYLHLEKPHEPLLFLPDGRTYDFCSCYATSAEGQWPNDPAMMSQRMQRYLMQVMDVDRLLGRTLDRMEETGLLDDAMLVVMSDHGASLLPGRFNREVTSDNADDILPIPMFVRVPGQSSPAVDQRTAQLTDLVPTVLDVLDYREDRAQFDGMSLLGPESDAPPPVLITRRGVEAMTVQPSAIRSQMGPWLEELFPVASDLTIFGLNGALVGELAADHMSEESDLVAVVNTTQHLAAVDTLEEAYAPAHIIGELFGREAPVEIAVAINGRIAGVGTTFYKDVWRISVMINPDYLRNGRNELELFEVEDRLLRRVTLR